MIEIDLQSRIPIYDQMVRGIVKLRSLRILKPHEQLPTVRAFATKLGVNPNTVSKAYGLLEAHGVIYTIPGKGSFIAPAEADAVHLIELAKSRLRDSMVEAYQIGVTRKAMEKIVSEIFAEGEESHD